MSQPLIFITTHTVKEGKLQTLRRVSDEFVQFVEANEPRMLALNASLDDDGNRLTVVQVHPDADSMDLHLRVAGEQIHAALDAVDNDAVEVYGTPGPVARELLEQIGGAGVRVTVNSQLLGGFARLPAANAGGVG